MNYYRSFARNFDWWRDPLTNILDTKRILLRLGLIIDDDDDDEGFTASELLANEERDRSVTETLRATDLLLEKCDRDSKLQMAFMAEIREEMLDVDRVLAGYRSEQVPNTNTNRSI